MVINPNLGKLPLFNKLLVIQFNIGSLNRTELLSKKQITDALQKWYT